MITLAEINKAVNNTVKEALDDLFPYPVPIVAEDVREPIISPSIKVILENVKSGKFNSHNRERSLTCRIYFFPKDFRKPKFENLQVREALETALLDGLVINETFIAPIESVDSAIVDSILVVSFDLEMLELLPDNDKSEPMEKIAVKIN